MEREKNQSFHLWGLLVYDKLYDISGPCGFCPCLWCQKVKHKMQLQEAEPAQERSVQSLVELQQFLAEQRRPV